MIGGERVKSHLAPGGSVTRARDARANHGGASGLFVSSEDVERVKAVNVNEAAAGKFLGLGGDVENSGARINCRRSGDADLGSDVGRSHIRAGHGSGSHGGIEEADLPEWRLARIRIRIERVNAVVFGGDVNYIVRAGARNRYVGNVERLRLNVAVHRAGKSLPNLPNITVAGVSAVSWRFCPVRPESLRQE